MANRTLVVAPLVAIALLGSAAAGHAADEWATYAIAEAPPAWKPAISRADMLIASLQSSLLAELTRELAVTPASTAVRACHVDTTWAAFRMARNEGIEIGRTSARLRSAANAPRPWARAVVERYAAAKGGDVAGFVVDLGDRVGILRPIVAQARCAACHGPKVTMDPLVKQALAERYPMDHAVGFETGDLRGWFWVEVPKP